MARQETGLSVNEEPAGVPFRPRLPLGAAVRLTTASP